MPFAPVPAIQRERFFHVRPIECEPCAGHAVFGCYNSSRIGVLRGLDLTFSRFPQPDGLRTVYTDSSLDHKIIIGQVNLDGKAQISVCSPDLQDTTVVKDGTAEYWTIGISGGSSLLVMDEMFKHYLYELDLNNLDALKTQTASKQFEGSTVANAFVIPLTSRVHLANVTSRRELAVVDFRDTTTMGASAWIRHPRRTDSYFFRGIKAACRIFLQDRHMGQDLFCVDRGIMRQTTITRSDPMGITSSMFSHSDIMPLIGMQHGSRIRLFDVKREQAIADIETGCDGIQPLFVDGMPQLVGIDNKSSKMGLIL